MSGQAQGTEFLHAILAKLRGLPLEEQQAIIAQAAADPRLWLPNPGPQTDALNSLADELFFGGVLGGGKTALIVGAALTQHQRSAVFRREYTQTRGIIEEIARVLRTRDGFNSTDHLWRIPGCDRTVELGSVPHEWDVEKWHGRAHDLKAFDEIAHFSKSQFTYLSLWLRSATPGQRTRVICAGNRPMNPEGYWVLEYWAAWLDPTYHDPAEPGELRWPVPAEEGHDKEVFLRSAEEAIAHLAQFRGPPRDHLGNILAPRSRTFIPSRLEDNPDLLASGYNRVLGHAPKNLQALARGDFNAAIEDHPQQLIPTRHIMDAQARWTPKPPEGAPMIAMGVDVAQGGSDKTCVAWRHDAWFAPLVLVPGSETPNPSDCVALVVRHRRDNAAVIVDCGGGYGGGVAEQLETHNSIWAVKYKGSKESNARSVCRTYRFRNKRAESWWRFREALDPNQSGGSPIALPNDPIIRADLAAPRFTDTIHGILLEEKSEIAKRLGRSPDAGDAIVLAWSEGQMAKRRAVRTTPRMILSPGAYHQLGVGYPSAGRGASPWKRRNGGGRIDGGTAIWDLPPPPRPTPAPPPQDHSWPPGTVKWLNPATGRLEEVEK
jgi:hypothetical protein